MTSFQETHYSLLRRLEEFEFSDYQRRIVTLVLDKSFGLGRANAWFPWLECFTVLRRMSRGNVSTTINGLVRARVIEKCGAGHYGIRLPVEQWAVPPRVTRTAALRDLEAWLDAGPAQTEMAPVGERLAEPPSLSQALREMAGEQSAAAACRGAMGRRDVGLGSGPVPETTGVPVSGTGVPVSGTERASACVATPVPESGTPHHDEDGTYDEVKGRKEEGRGVDWWIELETVIGSKDVSKYRRYYSCRWSENPDLCWRVLAEVREAKVEDGFNPGSRFFRLWQSATLCNMQPPTNLQRPTNVEEAIERGKFIGLSESDCRDWYRDAEACDFRRPDGRKFDNWPFQLVHYRDRLRESQARLNYGKNRSSGQKANRASGTTNERRISELGSSKGIIRA